MSPHGEPALSPRNKKILEISLLLLFVLAVTLPFIGQAVHIDAHLFIDWARQGLTDPLRQHLPNYDYFGVHYDEFHDTHPRLQSLYLTAVIWLTGGVSEQTLHLAMIPFPLIAAVGMYFLARRFRADAFVATLLLLAAPAFLVNTHLIMTDVPGIALWLAGLAFFVYGVDRGKKLLLALATLFFSLCIFDYYQGLSALPLALLYVLLYRKASFKTLAPIALPALLFVAFVVAHLVRYDQLPTFSYPFGLPIGPISVIIRVRGVTAFVGGVLLFPVVPLMLYLKSTRAVYTACAAAAAGAVWAAILYALGHASLESIFLLPLLLAAGVGVIWMVVSVFLGAVKKAYRGTGGQDPAFLSVWFLGTLFYCAFLLPYPSPRYLIPVVPPLAIFTARAIEQRWGADRRQYQLASAAIIGASLVLSLSIAIGEHQRANNNPVAAEWASQRLEGEPGAHWFNGGLGYQYYIERQDDFKMLLIDGDPLPIGDVIAESVHGNRWKMRKKMISQLELVEQKDFPRNWPVITENIQEGTSWLGQLGVIIPYGLSGDFLDRVYIYKVEREPDENVQEDEDS